MKAVMTFILCLAIYIGCRANEPDTIRTADINNMIFNNQDINYIPYDSAYKILPVKTAPDAPFKLTYYPDATEIMMDGNRQEIWSRYPAHHTKLYSYDSDYLDNITPNLSIFMNKQGTVVFMDTTRTRYMLIHPDGSEHLLPENSRQLVCQGFVHDKYWLFFGKGDYDYEQTNFDDEGEYYSGPEYSGSFFETGFGFLLVRDDGTIFKQVKLRNYGLVSGFGIDPEFRHIAFIWENYYQYEPIHGWVIADINGKVIKESPFGELERQSPVWSESGDLVLLCEYGLNRVFSVTDGKPIAILETQQPLAAISDAKAGLILQKIDDKLVLYNYRNKSIVSLLKLPKQLSQVTDLYLSGDGNEIVFTTESEQRFYRMGK